MKDTKKARLLKLLQRRWMTPLDALNAVGIISLSQRVSEWRRQGYVFAQREVRTEGGSRVAAYRMTGRPQ